MNTYTNKTQENKSQSLSNTVYQKKGRSTSSFQFVDNRPEADAQRKLQEMANNSSQFSQQRTLQYIADNRPQVKQDSNIQTKNSLSLPSSNKTFNVIQRVHFNQPPSRDIKTKDGSIKKGDSVLGAKCYAYSVFNAFAQVGKTPQINNQDMTQEEVDDWIKKNERDTIGGGPKMAAKKLSEQKISQISFRSINKKFKTATNFALAKKMPVCIGVSEPSNHWIYATGTDMNQILAVDQQNSNRGTIRFNFKNRIWTGVGDSDPKPVKTTYKISKFEVGYSNKQEHDSLNDFY